MICAVMVLPTLAPKITPMDWVRVMTPAVINQRSAAIEEWNAESGSRAESGICVELLFDFKLAQRRTAKRHPRMKVGLDRVHGQLGEDLTPARLDVDM